MTDSISETEKNDFLTCNRIKDLTNLLVDKLQKAEILSDDFPTDVFFSIPLLPTEVPIGQIQTINFKPPQFQLPDPTPYGDLGFFSISIINATPYKKIRTSTDKYFLECDKEGRCICLGTGGEIKMQDLKYRILIGEQQEPPPLQQNEQG